MLLKRIAACAFSFVLACGLAPAVASAQPADESSAQLQLEPGTYVEHEALAYVVDSTQEGVQQFSLTNGANLLDSGETLISVGNEAEEVALGDDAPQASAAYTARARSNDIDFSAGRIVLVHDDGLTTEEIIAQLKEDPRVVFVEPNYLLEMNESDPAEPASSDLSTAEDMTSFQWYANNSGTLSGQQPQDAVDVEYDAWEKAANSGSWTDAAAQEQSELDKVVVGVIDTGVDVANPDLAIVMWDDGMQIEALADLGGDEHGISMVPSTSSTEPVDVENIHGTHVAGIIAAEWNEFGTSGIATNVEIMSLRTDSSIAGTLSCFNYIVTAVNEGVNVRAVNCSWTLAATASKVLELGISEMGEAGVVSVFASGNDGSNNDDSIGMPSLLRDNPYVVTVDACDPSGDFSMFSSYGVATTDVVAPGSSILSTYGLCSPTYFGEADSDAVLYESFDEETRADASIENANAPILRFTDTDGNSIGTPVGSKRFDGDTALAVPYDAEEAQADTSLPVELANKQVIQSEPIDLSAVSDKAKCLSIRFASSDIAGDTSANRMADVQIAVRVTDSDDSYTLSLSSSFRAVNASWGGCHVALPNNTDYEHFQIYLYYANQSYSMLGGEASLAPADGTVLIDSIGIGDGESPYAYAQGTSMAAPVATGVVAVLAGQYPQDSAAKLAARLKGGVQCESRYADRCSTSGRVSVAGGSDPAPVPVSAELSAEGDAIVVRGYFVDSATQVRIGGVACDEISRTELVDGDGAVEITVRVPEGFAGGEQWVELATSDAESGRLYEDFGAYAVLSYYEQSDLPIPDELQNWSDWQLVGFASDIYAVPRESLNNVASASHEFFLKYDPDARSWSQVRFPLEQLKELGCVSVGNVSAATHDGALIMQITGTDDSTGESQATYWRYTAEGAWEHMPMSFPESSRSWITLSTLASDGQNLYSFGGYGEFYDYPGIPDLSTSMGILSCVAKLDLEVGEGTLAGMMEGDRENPQVAYRDGAFIVSGGQNTASQMNSAKGVERLTPLAEDKTVPLERPYSGEVTYPAGWLEAVQVDYSAVVTETGKMAWAPAATADGFMLVGPRSDSGKTDTYTLANETGAAPAEYGLNASHAALLNPSALAYDGMLYVLAAMSAEPYRVFVATPVETVPQPGDCVASDPDPGPTTPQPGHGEDPEPEPTTPEEEETLKNLANTGDALTAPIALLGVVACLTGAALLAQKQ